jgi:hypothetical protein
MGAMKIAAALLTLAALVVACSSSSSSGAGTCSGKDEGGACAVPDDCKPATCKCIDGTEGEVERACLKGACDTRSNCELRCRTHFGVDQFRICS